MSKFFYLLTLTVHLSSCTLVTDEIADTVNEYVKDLSPAQITEKIEYHYKLLGLMNSTGEWVHFYFNTYPNGFSLFPRYD